jgi:L-asparaginase II
MSGMDSLVPLIETSRGGTLECLHFGAVAVVDTHGEVAAHAGDPHWVTFTRSTLKPLQALPFVQAGGPRALGFTQEQVAMMCASHSGEPMHVAQVDGMLHKARLDYRCLQCGRHVPLFVELADAPPVTPYDERHHNCSGKHSGFLACCVQHGWPVDTYLDPAHPLQQAIRRDVARAGRGDWISKGGADGVQALASKSRGQAIALKIADGNKAALSAATVEVLDQLGWLDDAQREELAPWRARTIRSVRGAPVGERTTPFTLRFTRG